MVPYVDEVVAVTVMRVLLFVLHVLSPFLISCGFLLGCDQTANESLVPSVWFVSF